MLFSLRLYRGRTEMICRRKMGVIRTGSVVSEALPTGVPPLHSPYTGKRNKFRKGCKKCGN